jgi:hypothetical protein
MRAATETVSSRADEKLTAFVEMERAIQVFAMTLLVQVARKRYSVQMIQVALLPRRSV